MAETELEKATGRLLAGKGKGGDITLYVNDLAMRLRDVPAFYGVDQGDTDALLAIGALLKRLTVSKSEG